MNHGRIRIIALKGYSNSGKTSTLEYLVQYLNKNKKKTAVVKHIHHENFTIDQPGKDTWRLRKAGGEPIVSYSNNEIAFMTSLKLDLENTLTIIQQIHPELDYIFLEGFWQNLHPKIIFLREINDLEKLIHEFSKNLKFDEILESIFCVSGVYFTQDSSNKEIYFETLEKLCNQSIIKESQKTRLKSIPLLDIVDNQEKLLEFYNESEINSKK